MDIQNYISSGVIEAYVMGLATEEEVQILECVQKNNALVRQAVLEAQETLGILHQAQSVIPPAHLKPAIWAKIKEEENKEVKDTVKAFQPVIEPAEIKIKTKNSMYWAAAASFFLLLSVGLTGYFLKDRSKLQQELASLKTLQQDSEKSFLALNKKWALTINPNVRTISLAGVEKHPDSHALVYIDSKENKTYLSSEKLPPPPSGYQYQLWGLVNGTPVNAGVLALNNDKQVQEMIAIENAQTYAITLEKEGGSTVPTLANMYVIGNI